MLKRYILGLSDVGLADISRVGGKNASLGEMLQHLTGLGIRVPDGFVITTDAYRQFLQHNELEATIRRIVEKMDVDDIQSLQQSGAQIRELIAGGIFPKKMIEAISEAYQELCRVYRQTEADVAVRSSATAEDLPDASFAGQQETFLNISGTAQLVESVKKCFASLFTDRAISYRQAFGYDHFQVGISVCVQKMVRSDLAASGVAFSLDTESGFKDAVIINGSYGLGELIVQGAVSPDEFIVFKPALEQGYASIIEKKLGIKDRKMVYGETAAERVKTVSTSEAEQSAFCLSDSMVLQLSKWVVAIERYYSSLKSGWCPMDVEWAVDGISKELFIVQARPETIHSQRNQHIITEYIIENAGRKEKLLLKGVAVGDKIASGKVNILHSTDKLQAADFAKGDILVTDMTDPDWEPIIKKASAIITNKGGRTCHAAIVARELGIPAIVGSVKATEILSQGQVVTVSCAEGDQGLVYDGALAFRKKEFNLHDLPPIDVPVLLNIASPEMAFHFSQLPCKGVGLAREEFIINNYIKAHPLALLHHESLNDEWLSARINMLTRGYASGKDFFVEKLSYGIAKIAAAFYPYKVIVRFSDFKSNEYFNLLGGNHFEPKEENPMIGWRGASRYYSPEYKEAFGLECMAIKRVREELGLDNVVVMIPFCRSIKELLQVYETMEAFGLKRGKQGLEVYLMAELPSNIILAGLFAQYIDGFSIGSNDLTQLVLGLDRDSSLVAHIYDERNDAVKSMISSLINEAAKAKVKVGICGQAPSDFPDFAQFLVESGIDSISVTPDAYFKTVKAIHSIEMQLAEADSESGMAG
jgi:pyruvate,water dikinase